MDYWLIIKDGVGKRGRIGGKEDGSDKVIEGLKKNVDATEVKRPTPGVSLSLRNGYD